MRGRRIMGAVLAAVLGAGLLAATAPTAAAEMPGGWAPLDRCPVDNPAMLAADGRTVSASCLAAVASSGSIKLGGTTVTTGGTDLQLGVLNTGGTLTTVSPSGGALIGDPVAIPGGLLGLMCPSNIPVISQICEAITNGELNAVHATVEPAGEPSEFSLTAGLGVGQPIVRLPVKIRLSNPFLGSNCYIGSNSNPIVLRPANLTRPTRTLVRFNEDGSPNSTGPMGYAVSSGASQGDSTFAVPGASGCGLGGLLNFAVNLKQGLPSPAGNNSIVLDNATTYFGGFFNPGAFAPNQGQQLSDRWHAAAG